MQRKTTILIVASLVSLYLAVFFSFQVFSATKVLLQISFLDVGQGDAIYIKAPNGNDMLVDGGRTNTALLKKLKSAMSPGDSRLDIVLATHPDADHIGGLLAVIENYKVGHYIDPGIGAETKVYASLMGNIATANLPRTIARTETKIILDEKNGVVFRVLWPKGVNKNDETNDVSIVGILTYKDESFMLTGDAPTMAELGIVKHFPQATIETDVLKLGHHGSRTSSDEGFLQAIYPSIAIISAGCKNSYGHPHKEVTDRLAKLKIPTLSTCTSGTITFKTDGTTLNHKTEK
jgi:beta-lactamase superfamily II metal-dependent hydrolase